MLYICIKNEKPEVFVFCVHEVEVWSFKKLTNVFTLSLDLQSHFIRLTREFCICDLKRGDETI